MSTFERTRLVLADGYLAERSAKTAHGVLRYGRGKIAAVVDRQNAGKSLDEVLPQVRRKAPIVASGSTASSPTTANW